MVEIFACATALLSPEFVERVEPETLASKLIKVEKEYSVKFRKTKTSFNITGHWKAVREAHFSLLQLFPDFKSVRPPQSDPLDDASRLDSTLVDSAPEAVHLTPTDSTPFRDAKVCDNGHPQVPEVTQNKVQNDACPETNVESKVVKSTTNVESFPQFKGISNPKRGRNAKDKNQLNQVPEPFMYIHFQDESFANENSVNMDKVLDEFEKGPSSNKVKKEDLKKILDKNTEQMGRPLSKNSSKSSDLSKTNEKLPDVSHNQMYNHASMRSIVETQSSSYQDVSGVVSSQAPCLSQAIPQNVLAQNAWTLTNGMDKEDDQQSRSLLVIPRGLSTIGYIPSARMNDVPGLQSASQMNTLTDLFTRTLRDQARSEYPEYMTNRNGENGVLENSTVNGQQCVPEEYEKGHTKTVETENNRTVPNQVQTKPGSEVDSSSRINMRIHNEGLTSELLEADMGMVTRDTKQHNSIENMTKEGEGLSSAPFNNTIQKIGDKLHNPTDVIKRKAQRAKRPAKATKATKGKSSVEVIEKQEAKPTDRGVVSQGKDKPEIAEHTAEGFSEDLGNASEDKQDDKTKKSTTTYKCTDCDYHGTRKKRLTEHMGRVHGLLTQNCRGAQEQTLFGCNLCDKMFVFGKDLNRHKKFVHNGNSFFCEKCNKPYKSKYVFEKHMATHVEGYVQPMFKCQVCSREFTTKFSLGCHIKSKHLGLKKTFICPTCGKSFSQIRSYRQHANVHAGIRPYTCEICGKSFTYDKSLKEHRYMHDDIRRFSCTICNKAFRQRTCLLIHMKVHKNSKDHICSSCGKGFTQKQSLIRHERIHTGHRPYQCGLCSKSFSDYAVVRKHLLMSHKKGKTDWKDFVISEEKKMSDHYIVGGPGYVKRERSEKIREMNQATVIPSTMTGGRPVIMEKQTDRNGSQYTESVNTTSLGNNFYTNEQAYQKDNPDNAGFAVSQSNSEVPSYQLLFYTNTDSNLAQTQFNSHQGSSVSNTSASLTYPLNYTTLQNLPNPTYIVASSTEQGNNMDETTTGIPTYNSHVLTLGGINISNLEQDQRGQSVGSSVAYTQRPTLGLGHQGLNNGVTNATISATTVSSEPGQPQLSLTSTTLGSWGLSGYQTYFSNPQGE